jgi:hypothetical protein
MNNTSTPERIIAGKVTCESCSCIWFMVAPEIAEPPYECPQCRQFNGYFNPRCKVYGTAIKEDKKSTIWIDGYSRRFEGENLRQASISLKEAVKYLWRGDTSLMEAIT